MAVSYGQTKPCEMCGNKTLHHSDHSGGWDQCVRCSWMQDIRPTPGGQRGKLTDLPE